MRRFLFGALLAAAGVFIAPAAAWAHAELLSSTPGYGDRTAAPPAEVRLEFSGAMDLTGARLTLRDKGGRGQSLAHPTLAAPDRRVVAVPLPAHLADGDWSLDWFFLGNDGHLMGGEVAFAVGAPTPAAARPGAPVPVAKPTQRAIRTVRGATSTTTARSQTCLRAASRSSARSIGADSIP